ncbi:FkbM family methyltransferase [Pelagibacterales bacterium SAG-MED28]|nr:FkbM family methyltransferase [Pelagibacterales bacterium SAG-MED28]|tara:strand:- start:1009 stop:1707 length:699 start_codon:yes stop_codon:yes gene_type:complete
MILDYLSLFKKKFSSKKESYSYGTIDILVNYFFKNKYNGIYVDVGCQNPISNNNTYLLYKNKNWKGVNIDLDQKNIDLFNLVRKRDLNIKAAVSSGNFKQKIYFYHHKSAINTLEKKISNFQNAKVKKIIDVNTVTLNQLLSKNSIKKIDFLSVDVEGHEINVLKGFNIKKYSPQLVVIEFLDLKMKEFEFYNNSIKNILNSDIYKYFIKNNYSFVNWNHGDLVFVNNKIRD